VSYLGSSGFVDAGYEIDVTAIGSAELHGLSWLAIQSIAGKDEGQKISLEKFFAQTLSTASRSSSVMLRSRASKTRLRFGRPPGLPLILGRKGLALSGVLTWTHLPFCSQKARAA
jgi:hypothetical protein